MYFIRAILDILFPRKCFVCAGPGNLFCQKCQDSSPKPFAEVEPWIHSLFRYKGGIRKIIWKMKYYNAHSLVEDLAPRMYDELLSKLSEEFVEDMKITITPIPMTKKKKRERGFNQSEALAKELYRQNKDLFIYKEALLKVRETIPQAHIKNKQKRLQNMKGVFAAKEKLPKETVILVDDITTTGATLKEAKKVLKQAGAKKVFAITIGH